MHPGSLLDSVRRAGKRLILFSLILLLGGLMLEAKTIRLRNEIIETPSGTNQVVLPKASAQAKVSGLFLIQFNGALSPVQRAELKRTGVDLIKYVPDDAFVAKFNNVTAGQVAALAYVHWIGAYQSGYKIHPRLAAAMSEAAKTNRPVAISVLLSPTVTAAEITGLRVLFASVQQESHLRQGTILRGELAPQQLDALTQASAVLWVEAAPKRKLVDEAAAKLVGGDDGKVATPTVTQQMGYNGAGVTVCVADTGLDSGDTNTMHPDLKGRVKGFQFYGGLTDGSDGYGHGTHCAGIVAGNAATAETDPDSGAFYGLGVASGASLFIERIFDENANSVSPFPSDENLTQDAVRGGAKIGSNSWGDDVQGDYDIDAAQFDELVRDADANTAGDQPYILEFSAGNAGPDTQTMDSPASAKNVIATGASENVPGTQAQTYGLYADDAETMADFSSRGPCADGRLKPDLVAPGTWIASAASSAAPDEAAIAWATIDNYYVYMGGTSMSGPHAAGAAAIFVQYYQSLHTNAGPAPALGKAAFINSANELDESAGGPGPVPNNDEGWGRITLTNIIVTNFNNAPRFYQYLDQTVLLTNGQVYGQHIFVQGSDQPLKITLAYTDVPGFPGAIPALVNDLDLEVVAPDGTLYRGNQFGAGESVPNAPTPDTLNNVEGVYLLQPAPGDYLVLVRGSKVVQDARIDTAAIDQDFALVTSGNLPRRGQGFILLDRTNYTAPGTMLIEVLDAARAANRTVNVLVTNLTKHTGLTEVLNAAGNYGAFTGAVATVTGVAASGQIQIADGDALAAEYIDANGAQRVAKASAQLIPPTISAVTSGTDIGTLTISWQTSEPATSVVRYGTNSANLNLAVTNLTLVTSHAVRLTGLVAGKTYYFLVSSTDTAGNISVNNNSGTLYNFIGLATPTVLLVDAYETADGSPVIDDGTYTNVLAAAGVSYGFWKVTERGAPTLDDLQPFAVVIWRTTDDIVNYTGTNNTLTPAQQFMIQTYLNGGGSFFMASMGILSQLGDVPFRQNVLQVAGFKQNPDPPSPCSDCDEDFGVPAIFGAPASLANGVSLTLDYDNYPSFNFDDLNYGPDFSDTFTPSANATAITFESVSGKSCGMSYPQVGADSPGRVVFLSFPFDALPTNGLSPNNAVNVLHNIINLLAPGAGGVGVVLLDNQFYTTNEVVTVEVGDSLLVGSGQAQVSFNASSRTNQVIVTLNETKHRGLFRGTLTLVNGNPSANQLWVQNGATITATYFDAGNSRNVTATATIDTVPPVISQVAATTDYADAKVTWLTSKAADSTVQYGESLLPDRTASVTALVTNHSVTISGLSANRQYYYQVVSRDEAGNVTVDDNKGSLYTFTTLKAMAPPWSDNLEGKTADWTVVPDPAGTELNWTLGTPNNGLVTNAYSGTNAWCSDINGEQNILYASSYLYSPVIDLSGFQSATLTFWDVCDFSSQFEDGVVFVSTNSSTPLGSLPMAEDFTGTVADSWEQETVDLTPYVGQTIQVVFYCESVPADSPIYGWCIDDIGITGVAAGGTINVTKNLGQGIYTLSSSGTLGLVPIQSGTAPAATVSNLPAGQYVVQFGGVENYITPAAQTNQLVAGGTLNFAGNYTFLDVNHNGISDDWERDYFGSVSTNRTALTDTDGNGMTDYAKFIAGLNPTNPASKFIFTGVNRQGNGVVELSWTVATNRLYQINASTNLVSWSPLSDWLQASNNPTMSYIATNTGSRSSFYRVQVRP